MMPEGLLGIEGLERAEIEAILERAKDFQPLQNQSFKRLDLLRGKMIVNLFFEASTRTRTSFEIAAKRLGADAISITAAGSSVSKGETLIDTALNLHEPHFGESFNVGSGHKTTIAEVANIAAEIFSIAGQPAYGAMERRKWDIVDWFSDQEKTAEVLRWKARTDFREGLRKTADWYQTEPHAAFPPLWLATRTPRPFQLCTNG